MIKKFFFFFAFILCLIFSLTHCSAEENSKQDKVDGIEDSQDKPVDPLDIEELKKSAMVFTFEDIKSMSLEEMQNIIWPAGIIWFKDFHNWKLDQLHKDKRKFVIRKIGDSKNLSAEDINEIVIDNDQILKNLLFTQVQSLEPDLLRLYCDFETIDISIYPPEFIKQLSNEQLKAVATWLTVEQVLALDNNQIFYAGLNAYSPDRVVLNPKAVQALSVERLESLGNEIFRLPISSLTYEQFQVLDMDEILQSDREQSRKFSRKSLSPEQFSWLTVEQIPLLNMEYVFFDDIRYGLFEHLSEEQLKAFTSEQLESIEKINGIRLFSMDQVRFLVEYGTANSNMKTVIELIDAGPDVFKGAERALINQSLLPKKLGVFLSFLEPEQFKYIQEKQLVYALLITGYLPSLSPAQIYNMPYFVESLQVDTVLENARVFVESDRVLRNHIKEKYDTLNIINLLNEDQIRAIHPRQIPDLNEAQLNIIIRNKRNNRGLFIFTLEQFNALTPKQFEYMLVQDYDSEKFISEEQFSALSIAHINVLLEKLIPTAMEQELVARQRYLLEFGDIKLTANETPPERTSKKDIYEEFLRNHLLHYRVGRGIRRIYSQRVGGVCAPRYKEEKARIVDHNIVKFEAMDGLDICIFDILKYAGETWDQGALLEGCVNYTFDFLPDKFKEVCYQKSCLDSVVEQKLIAFKNYDKCLKEYHPELREIYKN